MEAIALIPSLIIPNYDTIIKPSVDSIILVTAQGFEKAAWF